MAKYKVCYEWSVCGEIEVEADSLDDAISIVDDMSMDDLEADYVDGSFEINHDFTLALNEVEWEA
jgi:hypothetical protein